MAATSGHGIDPYGYDGLVQKPAVPYIPAITSPQAGGSGTSFIPGKATGNYIQTPQSQAVLEMLWPGMQQYASALSGGGSLYNVPQAPMPNQGWFSGLDPSITQGLWEPYQQGSQQLAEQLGSYGQLGSARGGVAGAGAAGLGKYWEQAGRDVGLSAWSMINPNQMAQYQAQTQAQQMPWLTMPSVFGNAMPTPYIKQGDSGGGGGKK